MLSSQDLFLYSKGKVKESERDGNRGKEGDEASTHIRTYAGE